MSFRRGFLYWGNIDKRRPLLVVSSDRFNTRSDYVTVIPGSSRLRPLVTHVKLARSEGGVPRPTMLLCEHLRTVHRSDLESEEMGPPVRPGRMREVEDAILLYLDINRARSAES